MTGAELVKLLRELSVFLVVVILVLNFLLDVQILERKLSQHMMLDGIVQLHFFKSLGLHLIVVPMLLVNLSIRWICNSFFHLLHSFLYQKLLLILRILHHDLLLIHGCLLLLHRVNQLHRIAIIVAHGS